MSEKTDIVWLMPDVETRDRVDNELKKKTKKKLIESSFLGGPNEAYAITHDFYTEHKQQIDKVMRKYGIQKASVHLDEFYDISENGFPNDVHNIRQGTFSQILPYKPKTIEDAFSAADVNKDGGLNFDELNRAQQLFQLLKEAGVIEGQVPPRPPKPLDGPLLVQNQKPNERGGWEI